MSTEYLDLNVWDGLSPVLFPLGQKTMQHIGMAAVGVAVPFILFLLAMFDFVHPIFIKNYEADVEYHSMAAAPSRATAARPPDYYRGEPAYPQPEPQYYASPPQRYNSSPEVAYAAYNAAEYAASRGGFR